MGFFNGSDTQKLTNVAAGTYQMTLRGGSYVVETVSTGSGTIDLQRLSPDGSWRNTMITQITATTGYQGSPGTALNLSPGMYQFVVVGFSANYITITRVPTAVE